jgi:glycosyltransferase involved in cell wall biosynthesis
VSDNKLKSKQAYLNLEVAVIVLTYNQEDILHDCIDSILSQKLKSATLKIFVIDDASTDGTKFVIERYQMENPNLIFPVLHQTNQYQSGKAPEFSTLRNIMSSHVAFCDGDDYWTDELKLEKQIQRFIEDESLAVVHSDYYFGKSINSKIHLQARTEKEKQKARRVKNSFDLIQGNDIKKSTALFRTTALDFDLLDRCIGIRAQDWVVAIGAGSNGGIHYIEDATTCYRLSEFATFQTLDQLEKLRIKDEVRWFCATNLQDGKLRDEFRRFLFRQECRRIVRSNPIYRILRPLVLVFRKIKILGGS